MGKMIHSQWQKLKIGDEMIRIGDVDAKKLKPFPLPANKTLAAARRRAVAALDKARKTCEAGDVDIARKFADRYHDLSARAHSDFRRTNS